MKKCAAKKKYFAHNTRGLVIIKLLAYKLRNLKTPESKIERLTNKKL